MSTYYLAIDIGASGGRHILGHLAAQIGRELILLFSRRYIRGLRCSRTCGVRGFRQSGGAGQHCNAQADGGDFLDILHGGFLPFVFVAFFLLRFQVSGLRSPEATGSG